MVNRHHSIIRSMLYQQCFNIVHLWFSNTWALDKHLYSISNNKSDDILIQLWFSDTWAPDEHFIPTLVRVSVDSHLHVLQVLILIIIIVILFIIIPMCSRCSF